MTSKPEIDFLAEINCKYADLEDELEQKLNILAEEERKLLVADEKLEKSYLENNQKSCNSFEEAKQRNSEILKSFEQAKARLRSRTTYSPIETILQKAIRNYRKEYSLVPITKKAYGPTYV